MRWQSFSFLTLTLFMRERLMIIWQRPFLIHFIGSKQFAFLKQLKQKKIFKTISVD